MYLFINFEYNVLCLKLLRKEAFICTHYLEDTDIILIYILGNLLTIGSLLTIDIHVLDILASDIHLTIEILTSDIDINFSVLNPLKSLVYHCHVRNNDILGTFPAC